MNFRAFALVACLLLPLCVACGGGGSTAQSGSILPGSISNAGSSPVSGPGTSTTPVGGLATTAGVVNGTSATSTTGTDYPSTVLGDGPIAYYRLGDSSNVLTDASGHALNGTYGANVRRGSASLTSATTDLAATFPGAAPGSDDTPDVASVIKNAAFETPTTGFSVEAWIAPSALNTTNSYQPIASYGREIQGEAWVIQENPQAYANFYVKTSGGSASSYSINGISKLAPGNTYHIIGTYDGSMLRLYVNGALEASVAASGSINFSGIQPQWGLGIGGALGSNLAAFSGVIDDVSIYAKALSSTQVANHYLIGNAIPLLTETPFNSDAFVDTVGVVTHVHDGSLPYNTTWSTFLSMISASGIRHIRDGLFATGTSTWYADRINALGAAGIHATLESDKTQQASDIATLLPKFAGTVEAVESPNEPDLSGDPNWVADTVAFQKMLYATVKGNPATANLPVLAPAIVTGAVAEQAVGNLSSYADYSNMHDYFSGYNPGTPGWGSITPYGIYGSIGYNVKLAGIPTGNKPVMATETGWGQYPLDPSRIDDRTLARYVGRLYFEHFLAGVKRTTIYEFYDENGGTNPFSYFGLVHNDNTPKPSYTELSGILHTLADPGSTFSTSPFKYRISGNINNLHHLLMQRRDGSYQLALWLEVSSFNTATQTDIIAPKQSVTIAPLTAPSTAKFTSFDVNGNMSTAAVTLSGGAATVQVDDSISILTFK